MVLGSRAIVIYIQVISSWLAPIIPSDIYEREKRHKKLLLICIFIIPQWIPRTGTDAAWILMRSQQLSWRAKQYIETNCNLPLEFTISLMVDSFVNDFIVIIIISSLIQDCSPFHWVSSQIDSGLQYIFICVLKQIWSCSLLLQPKPQTIPVYMLNIYAVCTSERRNPSCTLHSAEGHSIFICF